MSSDRRAFASDGMVRIVGPATVTGVQFYGLLPVTDCTITDVTAPGVYTWTDGAPASVMLESVDLTAWNEYPAMITALTVPDGAEVYGLLAVPL